MKTRSILLLLAIAAGCGNDSPQAGKEEHAEHAGEESHEGEGHEGEGQEGEGHEGEGHEGEGQEVHIAPEAVEKSGIAIGSAERRTLIGGVEVPAEVQMNPERTAHVAALVSGQISEVKAQLGDDVKKGQVLAMLRSTSLGEARGAIATARAGLELAQANYRRQQLLKSEGIGAEKAYLEALGELRKAQAELRAARERLGVYGGQSGSGATVAIKSPLDGVVVERHATVGEVVSPETAMFIVGDLSRVWVVGRVYEQDVAAAQVGAPAVVTLQAYPGRSWEGTITYVASALDADTRTLSIRVELDNPDGLLKPGLFGEIALSPPGEAGAEVIAVPEAAVQRVGDRSVVFIPGDEPGAFRPVDVEPGGTRGGMVAIRRGLEPGQKVVVAGAFTLRSELQRGELAEHDH